MEKELDRVIVTKPYNGLVAMQVCAVTDATDEEILGVCNTQNPSGTENGWGRVIRTAEDEGEKKVLPVQCKDHPERVHYVVTC